MIKGKHAALVRDGDWHGPLDAETWETIGLCERDPRALASFGAFIDDKIGVWAWTAMRIGGEESVPWWHRVGEAQATRRWLLARTAT